MSIKNILVHSYSFNIKCGGITVGFELCKILDNMGINVRIIAPKKIGNSIFTKYYDNDFNLDETLVIYGETIQGNPLNAKFYLWVTLKCSTSPVSSNYFAAIWCDLVPKSCYRFIYFSYYIFRFILFRTRYSSIIYSINCSNISYYILIKIYFIFTFKLKSITVSFIFGILYCIRDKN